MINFIQHLMTICYTLAKYLSKINFNVYFILMAIIYMVKYTCTYIHIYDFITFFFLIMISVKEI